MKKSFSSRRVARKVGVDNESDDDETSETTTIKGEQIPPNITSPSL
jgi:hypothetical protein